MSTGVFVCVFVCGLYDNWLTQMVNFSPCTFSTGSMCTAVAFVLRQSLKPHFLAKGQSAREERRGVQRRNQLFMKLSKMNRQQGGVLVHTS